MYTLRRNIEILPISQNGKLHLLVNRYLPKGVENVVYDHDFSVAYCFLNQHLHYVLDKENISTDINMVKIVNLLEWSSAQGCSEAKVELAMLYKFGNGVTQDLNKAQELLTEAAQQNDPDAFECLARIWYENGETNLQKIMDCFYCEFEISSETLGMDIIKKEISRGSHEAEYLLGYMIYRHEFIYNEDKILLSFFNKNIWKGLRLLIRAAKNGNQPAKVYLKKQIFSVITFTGYGIALIVTPLWIILSLFIS